MIHKLPKILGINRFGQVSYSELIDLQKCLLKGSEKHLTLSTPLPDSIPTRATIIGIFHHKAMELATLGLPQEELENRLEDLIAASQVAASAWRHLRRLGSVSNWDEINQSFTSAMRWNRAQRERETCNVVKVESTLTSSDGVFFGKPDRYAIAGDQAFLTEFKTSGLRDSEGEIRKEYLTQLLFYAALLIDHYPVRQVTAQLESSTGEEFSLIVGTNEAHRFATEVKRSVEDANQRIAGLHSPLDLATPSADACNYCNLRVLCKAFASGQKELNLARGQFVLTATVKSLAASEETGSTASLELQQADNTFRLIVPDGVISQLLKQRRYAFVNLDATPTGFRWTDTTQVFSVD